MVTKRITDDRRRDRILAGQAAAILLVQLVGWLVLFYVGFSLLLWPFEPGGIAEAFNTAGPACVLGPTRPWAPRRRRSPDLAAFFGLITLTLQIAYLPTLYSEFNRRETEVALLNARGGVPSWGPELLARTHYALGSGMSTLDTLPDLYEQWERWAADVAESHTTYLPLVRFRSPRPLSSWVTGAAGRARLGRAVPRAVPGGRARGPGPAVPAQRVHLLPRGRAGHGHRRP